jgi:hypothetical protein
MRPRRIQTHRKQTRDSVDERLLLFPNGFKLPSDSNIFFLSDLNPERQCFRINRRGDRVSLTHFLAFYVDVSKIGSRHDMQ